MMFAINLHLVGPSFIILDLYMNITSMVKLVHNQLHYEAMLKFTSVNQK